MALGRRRRRALIINGLAAGPHKILIELVNASHQTLEKGVVNFRDPTSD